MKTFEPIVRLHEFKVGLTESDILPKNFETRYLEATMKNVKLSEAFAFEFKYGLPHGVTEDIKRQLGLSIKNACLVVIELYPGVVVVMESTSPAVKTGICCDYEVPMFEKSLS